MQCYPVNAKAKKHSFPGSYPAGIIGHFSWPVLPFVSFVNLCALPIRRPIRIHLRPFAPVALGCTWLHLVALQKKFAGSLCCLPVATPIFPKTPEIEVQSHPIEPNMTKFFSIPVFFPPFYRPHTSVHVLVGLMFEVHRCLITERAVDPLPVIGGISFRTPPPYDSVRLESSPLRRWCPRFESWQQSSTFLKPRIAAGQVSRADSGLRMTAVHLVVECRCGL
jgi:hypothetical protein